MANGKAMHHNSKGGRISSFPFMIIQFCSLRFYKANVPMDHHFMLLEFCFASGWWETWSHIINCSFFVSSPYSCSPQQEQRHSFSAHSKLHSTDNSPFPTSHQLFLLVHYIPRGCPYVPLLLWELPFMQLSNRTKIHFWSLGICALDWFQQNRAGGQAQVWRTHHFMWNPGGSPFVCNPSSTLKWVYSPKSPSKFRPANKVVDFVLSCWIEYWLSAFGIL